MNAPKLLWRAPDGPRVEWREVPHPPPAPGLVPLADELEPWLVVDGQAVRITHEQALAIEAAG
jgi:hypothetical protein